MVMKGRLTESEWRRIAEFAETPKHQRCPEQLLPEGAQDLPNPGDGSDRVQADQ